MQEEDKPRTRGWFSSLCEWMDGWTDRQMGRQTEGSVEGREVGAGGKGLTPRSRGLLAPTLVHGEPGALGRRDDRTLG